jgi:hypothetical protein
LDNYAERIRQSTSDHRPETNQGRHHCLHEALFVIWDKVRYIDQHKAIPELEPINFIPSERASQPIEVEAEPEPEPTVAEYSGIVIGHDEDEEEALDEDDEET